MMNFNFESQFLYKLSEIVLTKYIKFLNYICNAGPGLNPWQPGVVGGRSCAAIGFA